MAHLDEQFMLPRNQDTSPEDEIQGIHKRMVGVEKY
jgi:hypothetical protein